MRGGRVNEGQREKSRARKAYTKVEKKRGEERKKLTKGSAESKIIDRFRKGWRKAHEEE